jgi:transposase
LDFLTDHVNGDNGYREGDHKHAQLKHFKFSKRSEQLWPHKASRLDNLIDANIEAELEALQFAPVAAEVGKTPSVH